MPQLNLATCYSGANAAASLGGAIGGDVDAVYVSSNTITYSSGDNITGIYFIGAVGISPTNLTVDWVSATSTLSVTPTAGTQTSIVLGSDGLYFLINDAGYVVFKLVNAELSAGTFQGTYVLAEVDNAIFDDVAFAERSSNHKNYRCLWLVNLGATSIDVGISTSSAPTYGEITYGSEYFVKTNLLTGAYIESRARLGTRGKYLFTAYNEGLPSTPNINTTYFAQSSVFVGALSRVGTLQDSDGSTGDLPTTLSSDNDPNGDLNGVDFYQSLNFTIEVGKAVSFWVKRFVGAGVSGSVETPDTFSMRILYVE